MKQCNQKLDNETNKCPLCGRSSEIIDGFLCFSPELARINSGFDPTHFSQLSVLEESSFWFRSRNHLIIWALKHFFSEAKNFLEIGCGTGYVLCGIEQAKLGISLFGSEIFCEGLKYAKKRLKTVELFQMDACKIPFENEFDVIGAFDVLEHIDDDVLALLQMYKAVKTQGGIIITVPQHKFLWSKSDEAAFHVRRYTVDELKGKVEKAGFKITRITSFMTILFPLMIASRYKSKLFDKKYNPKAEYASGDTINKLLEKILVFEQFFLRHGCNFPFGGSLILIAKKIICQR